MFSQHAQACRKAIVINVILARLNVNDDLLADIFFGFYSGADAVFIKFLATPSYLF